MGAVAVEGDRDARRIGVVEALVVVPEGEARISSRVSTGVVVASSVEDVTR